MKKPARLLMGNLRLTTSIAVMAVSMIIVSLLAVTIALYVNLSASARAMALADQTTNLRMASTIFEVQLPGTDVTWASDGQLERIGVKKMPRLLNTNLVDSVAGITGNAVSFMQWDAESGTFLTTSTTGMLADGTRDNAVTLGKDHPAFAAVTAGKRFEGETLVGGRPAYSTYQPLLTADGAVVGLLLIAADKAKSDAIVFDTVKLLLLVAAGVLAIVGTLAVFVSHRLTRSIPTLSKAMSAIAEGQHDTQVPYTVYKNEVGVMARTVEVFRANSERIIKLGEDEVQASQDRHHERARMMQDLQRAFGAVVDAAIAGDFSKRVEAQFPDEELNTLAGSVNTLVETVDRGLEETGHVLAALADTDLTRRVEGDYLGAFAKLKDDTNRVGDKLTEIVTQLRDTSRALKTATGEILSGANDLSERTTKQAATIEETSAAMEQLATTVLQNADRARDASQNAGSVTKAAEEGGVVMGQANEAMERITTSSAKISNIIGMIDDIAFQTNLLALNASVEAARAGEAGKGFAVVAVEVRRLAQSAAEASKEVKVLIDQSAGEVKGGSKLVADAAAKLATMVEAARANNALIDSIARESREQASAIDEVNTAVRQMDEMTQHNAALVEETNAAIEQTEAQATELDRIVEIFAIDVREQLPAAPAPATGHNGIRALQSRVRTAARAYLTNGNAAIDKDWAEF